MPGVTLEVDGDTLTGVFPEVDGNTDSLCLFEEVEVNVPLIVNGKASSNDEVITL